MFGIRKRRPPPFGGVHVDDDKDIQEHRPEEAQRNDLWSESRLLLRDLIFALMIAVLVVVFIVQPVKVEGTSMLPRLHDGERIFVNKLIYYDDYRWAPKIERGDIVVFWFPDDPSKSYIKRVIGVAGDRVRIDDGQLFLNDRPIEEDYVPRDYADQRSFQEVTVPAESFFVLGDHRNMSNDSRDFGPVKQGFIYGKAVFGYWPMEKLGRLR